MTGEKNVPLTFTESSWALLAGTRFVLAAIVLLSHLIWFVPPPAPGQWLLEAVDGKAAVVGFLLISGLSIGYSYRQRPGGYYARRFLRIYPLYFFAVALAVALAYLVGSPYRVGNFDFVKSGWKTALGNFLLLQDFVAIPYPFNLPVWTLSVEVFFYLLVPLLARTRPVFIALTVAASLGFYLERNPGWTYGVLPAAFGWAWLVGFVVAYRGWSFATLLPVLVGAALPWFHYTYLQGGLCWLPIVGTAAIIHAAPRVRLPTRLRAILNYLGELSYPLYLFHVPLAIAFHRFAGLRGYLPLLGSILAGSALLNVVFDHWLKAVFWRPLVTWVTGLRREKTASAVVTAS